MLLLRLIAFRIFSNFVCNLRILSAHLGSVGTLEWIPTFHGIIRLSSEEIVIPRITSAFPAFLCARTFDGNSTRALYNQLSTLPSVNVVTRWNYSVNQVRGRFPAMDGIDQLSSAATKQTTSVLAKLMWLKEAYHPSLHVYAGLCESKWKVNLM